MGNKKKTNQEESATNVVAFDANTKPSPSKVQVGDWVYCFYQLMQVKTVNDKGEVTEASDGNLTLKAAENQNLDANIKPLTPNIKAASEAIKKVEEEFSGYSTYARLNSTEVFAFLVARWHELCVAETKEAQETVAKEIDRLRKSIVGVIGELHKLKFDIHPPKEGEKTEDKKGTPQFQLFK